MITALSPLGRVTRNSALYDRRWDAFAFRVKQFTRSLSRERCTAVANRPRFYSMPYLRHTDATDPDDLLP